MRNQDSLRVVIGFAGIPSRWSGKMPFAGVEWKKTLRDSTFVSHKKREKPTDGDFKHKAHPFFWFVLFSTGVKRHQLRQGVFRRRLNTKREKHKTFWQNIAQFVSFSIPSAPCVIRLLLFLRGRVCVFASACTWHICYATDKKKRSVRSKGLVPSPNHRALVYPRANTPSPAAAPWWALPPFKAHTHQLT